MFCMRASMVGSGSDQSLTGLNILHAGYSYSCIP